MIDIWKIRKFTIKGVSELKSKLLQGGYKRITKTKIELAVTV